MPAIVRRARNISGLTTNQLVVKDFALEPSDERMRRAAYLMGRHLAGHIALAGSRETLRMRIEKEMRGLLVQNGFTEVCAGRACPSRLTLLLRASTR